MKLSGLTQYSPPFARGGQGANFAVDVLDVPGAGAVLNVIVETKNSEDTLWNTLASFAAINSTGVKNIDATAIMEQLRFTYAITGGTATSTFYINVLEPAWRP